MTLISPVPVPDDPIAAAQGSLRGKIGSTRRRTTFGVQPVARAARAEGLDVVALPDSEGRRP